MTICYFTATGNCLYVARKIGGTLLSIPQLMRQPAFVPSSIALGCNGYEAYMQQILTPYGV